MYDDVYLDAVLDTGANYCMVPESHATLLGFHSGNRLGVERVNAVGGGKLVLNRHSLERVRVGDAQAPHVQFLVGSIGPDWSLYALLGMSFLERFASTTVDLVGGRVVFRGSR